MTDSKLFNKTVDELVDFIIRADSAQDIETKYPIYTQLQVAAAKAFTTLEGDFITAVIQKLEAEGFAPEVLDKHSPAYWRRFPERFEQADIIIGMTRWHKYFIPKKWRGKYVDLAELATGTYTPVPDPFLAKTQEKYNEVMRVLDKYLTMVADKLKQDNLN